MEVLNGGSGELQLYKIFNFREQTLKMGANDAPAGQPSQSAIKNKHRTKFLRKLWVFQR
jgi:hypothetical protein